MGQVEAEALERIEAKLDAIMMAPKAPQLMTVKEVAAVLHKSEDYVRRRLSKKIPVVREGRLLFDVVDINRYIESLKR